MVEDCTLPRIILTGDIGAGLLVEPPGRQVQFLGHQAGFVKNDPVRNEERVNVSGDSVSVIRERHRGATNDEEVGYDPAPYEPVTEQCKRVFEVDTAE
jgi:hypothetical protein